jgi:D-glycero-D-manno-heptose 1,7-bisphosphate phosphatase
MLDIFDKDGTLVETKSGEPFPKLGDQRLISGVKERIADSAAAGNIIVVASNQGGIEKGYKPLEDAIAEFQEVMKLLPEISMCLFCPDFAGNDCWIVANPLQNAINVFPPDTTHVLFRSSSLNEIFISFAYRAGKNNNVPTL